MDGSWTHPTPLVAQDDKLLVGDQWDFTMVYFLPLAHKVDHTVKTFNRSVDVQKVRVTPMDALAFDDGVKIHWTV